MTSIKQLATAINTIAEFMYEPIERKDEETGLIFEVNSLAYPQKRILNGLAYAACTSRDFAIKAQDEAATKVRLAIKSHRGDELSEVKLTRSLDWKERLDVQVAALDQLAEQAVLAYAQHTGEDFKMPVRLGKTDSKFQSPALERAKAMGLGDGEQIMGGGVEVAAQEAA